MLELTPTQQRIYDLLKDGKPHAPTEIRECLWDELGHVKNIKKHIHLLRKALKPEGKGILVDYVPPGRRLHYRQVRFLNQET